MGICPGLRLLGHLWHWDVQVVGASHPAVEAAVKRVQHILQRGLESYVGDVMAWITWASAKGYGGTITLENIYDIALKKEF